MSTYITKQGDMWDSIAHVQLGSVNHADKLMNANPGYLNYFIFPAGITLDLPDIDANSSLAVPPWREVAG